MATTALRLYKLIILYMLNRVDFPLTNSQLSEFILDQGYTNYFKLQQTISDLAEEGFIHEESTHSRTYYHLTEEGAQTVRFFGGDISPEIRADIDRFLRDKKYDLKNESAVRSDYFPNELGEYGVRCQVFEHDHPLIDLTVTAPTENQARTMADNWSKKSQEIYSLIMEKLL